MFTTLEIRFGENEGYLGEDGHYILTTSKVDFLKWVREIGGDEVATKFDDIKGVIVYTPEETEIDDIGDRAFSSTSSAQVFYTDHFTPELLDAFYDGQSLSRFLV